MEETWKEFMPYALDEDDSHLCSSPIISEGRHAAFYSKKWAEVSCHGVDGLLGGNYPGDGHGGVISDDVPFVWHELLKGIFTYMSSFWECLDIYWNYYWGV